MTTLIELAEQVEKLTGPCRETDNAIKLAIAAQVFASGATKDDAVRILGGDLYAESLPYTASLDAAMTLLPPLDEKLRPLKITLGVSESGTRFAACIENWRWGTIKSDRAASSPNALCSAILRARATLDIRP